MLEREEIRVDTLVSRRMQLGLPSEGERKSVIENGAFQVGYLMREFDKRKKEIKNYLFQLKSTEEESNNSITRPVLCCEFIADTTQKYLVEATEKAIENRDTANARFYCDFFEGINMVTSTIHIADAEFSGKGEKDRVDAVALIEQQGNNSEINDIETYLFLKNYTQNCAALLVKDFSGSVLIDAVLKEVEEDAKNGIYSPQCGDYIVMGAKYAAYLYKKIYQLAEPLYPPEPQG